MAQNRRDSNNLYESRKNFLSLGIKCVFISHQQRDKDAAKKIADYLIDTGINVYFDAYDKDLKIHHQSRDAKAVTNSIKKGINNSTHMLAVVSPSTLNSSWVPFEIGYGQDKTELFVLCLKGIPKGSLPEYVKSATVIRDIWDLNTFITNTNGNLKPLFESKRTFNYANDVNPLATIMDSLINENY